MATSPSPIPHVSESLEPYIQPRATVASIRQSLHSHLERQLRLEATQTLSLANVTNPPLTQTLPEPPASVTGVRRAYWRALRAHQVARERYEGLRAELDVVAKNAGDGVNVAGEEGPGKELLPLVRAREKRRRLGAVEKALEAIEREGKGVVGAKVDDVVKRNVGELPVPPSQRSVVGGGGGREEGEMRVVELKKAVLSAQATIAKCEEEGVSVGGPGAGDAELYALRQARNELIGWIEKQLALIGDAQTGETAPSSPEKGQSEEGEVASQEDITRLYDRYLHARCTLLETLQSPQDISPLAPAPESPKASRSCQENDNADSASVALLPFLEPLLAAKSEEQNLVQHAAYFRRQLSAADAASERLMRRFADESHLVHPGAAHGRDWAQAAEEVNETTREFVFSRTAAGEASTKKAEATLKEIERIPEGLEKLSVKG